MNIVELDEMEARFDHETPAAQTRRLIENICRVFVGKEEVAGRAVLVLVAGGHLLLEDVPGLGKTLLAKAMAKSMHAEFKRIQFTADLLPSDITGSSIFNQQRATFEIVATVVVQSPTMCLRVVFRGVYAVLADHLDRRRQIPA